jgi:NAD+ diphosphatase
MLHTPADFLPLHTPAPGAIAWTFVCRGDKILLREADFALPEPALLAALQDPSAVSGPAQALGSWGGRYYQTVAAGAHCPLPAGHAFLSLRALFGAVPDGFLGLAGRAVQLAEWVRTHRYCGACATPTRQLAGERCFQCPSCGLSAYPRISPAMMVLIRRGATVLLAQHANAPAGRYTALAGFLEAGESVEEAVHREVYEEVGLRVHKLRYFGSQSWPFPHSLMLAYTADYLDGEIRVDPAEIADARWFGAGDTWPDFAHTVSIAAELVHAHRPPM